MSKSEMESKMKKICFISSGGGHFEQIRQLKELADRFECYYVLPVNKSTKKFKRKKYLVSDFYRKRKIQFVFQLALTSIQQLLIFLKEMPDVVITTGAGVAIPTCLLAKLFKKKLIYIESFARMKTLNKTGEFLYKYADLFMVQWENLLEFAPNAVYRGWIY